MTLHEMLNPWTALRRAKIEVDILRREQTLLLDELKKAQHTGTLLINNNKKLLDDLAKARKNDSRGKDGKFKKGEGK